MEKDFETLQKELADANKKVAELEAKNHDQEIKIKTLNDAMLHIKTNKNNEEDELDYE